MVDASWILTAPDTWVYRSVAEAFHERGMSLPRISLMAPSALLRANLLGNGPFVTALPSSVLRLGTGSRSLKALPIGLHIRGYPLACQHRLRFRQNPTVRASTFGPEGGGGV